MNIGTKHLKKEDVEDFIREYISEYRTYLEEKHPNRKSDFPFYRKYPFDVKAYVSKKSTLITYKYNAPTLKIEVFEVDKVPDWRHLQKEAYVVVFANVYFSRTIDKPKDVAIREILDFFSQEEYDREQAEIYEKLHCEAVEAEVSDTVKGYLNYLNHAYNVQNETLEKHKTDLYEVTQLVSKHERYHSAYLIAECENLADVTTELSKDIESSIFLSVHANYRAANILLRRLLEVTISAIYFDYHLKNDKSNIKKYKKTVKKHDKWLKNLNPIHFTGNGGFLSGLIVGDTNNKATQLLNISNYANENFEDYVTNIYKELSKHIHYGGKSSGDVLDGFTLDFVEYDEIRFKEWYNKLNQIHEICNIIILLKFPEMITLSEKYENDYISFPTLNNTQLSKLKEMQKAPE